MGQKLQPKVKLLASCMERAHLNMTRAHDMSFQGTHITNSDGCVVTMLPTPCTAADQHAGSLRRPPGRNGTSRPADNAGAWHQLRTGARRGAIPITICIVGGTRTKEKKGPTVLEAFLSLPLLPLSLCVTCSSPSSIKGEAGRSRRGTAVHHCTRL